ncbi:voltage-dependent calcium channel subunit alpha-2/delta-4 isoform X2 [Bradysia coprophila]|uniref:voltage-dependent calcium channel subunit alpha-2/delta-4 isoform X2 n=1 Tax=Bradysia coprophila TaxID=38358 RepID=UPI00187DC6DF|nr:voltage-dependent calcium channel subunit alpha-2/delta-4 isoform X2 [Bradysia coprophila]
MSRNVAVVSILFVIFLTTTTLVIGDQEEDIPHNEVRNWALKFGVDLWAFGKQFTKLNDIKNKYKDLEGEVTRKDGILLLRELATEVKNFMEFKMNAVMRIMDSAEQAALSEESSQSQSSQTRFYDAHRFTDYASDAKHDKDLLLKPMRRFDKLSVNLSLSSILVPSGVDDTKDPDYQSQIAWSSHLDPLFSNNLERDSALSWQYYGSSRGFMRRFPSIHEPLNNEKSTHDFRTEDWFIQAASSPKDIMILLDSSGSMSGSSFEIAIATIEAILDTLSDNDYVNLIVFSDVTRSAVPCFKDKMVRATSDNIKEILAAMKAVKCENVANFTAGFEYAFELLHRYNQSGLGSQCNQAIMLITDGLSETHNEVIKHYNWPHMPVRIFTYLINGDSSSRENMHSIACTNKGYYVQINSEEEARRRVIEYALVMARPMVLYQADHPIHWSHVFVGGLSRPNFGKHGNAQRLFTTVSTPVYDRRNTSVRVANLLGVVGTDVPIEDIKKMVPQYKLGVNGYSFIVDNNGRVLYHPDLRTDNDESNYLESLKPKYKSTDLTEVELPETEPKKNNNNISDKEDENTNYLLDMRQEMVMQKEGEMEFTVLTHLDDMKRVSMRTQRYFYGPIEGTPFTLALALPDKYGMHELSSQEEIRHSHQNVTEYLKGENWRVHPDWVYCEYNNLHDFGKERDSSAEFPADQENTTFDTPEKQILHFLARAGRPRWKWMSVRPRSPQPHYGGSSSGQNQHILNAQSRKSEPYYCDRALLQTLVRDAMVTDGMDRPSHATRKEDKHQGYQMFGVKLSFVATRSGLLRWVDHLPVNKDANDTTNFGDENAKAIDMSWYKRAVDQDQIDSESFVFSVPFDSGYTSKTNATLVTAAHAIFIEHKGHKAPAAVVGLQFQHDTLARHFINITSTCTSGACPKTCASDELDCYMLDNNGFVIISENTEHTGRFFGNIDGTIMDSLVQDRIYRRVALMDYQGLCSGENSPYSSANRMKPIQAMSWLLKYFLTYTMTWLSTIPTPVASWAHYVSENYGDKDLDDVDESNYSEDDYDEEPNVDIDFTTQETESVTMKPKSVQPPPTPRVTTNQHNSRPCDLKTDLYILQPERLNSSTPLKGKLTNCHSSGCERPFSVQKIPHSNLILLVVDTLCPCGSKQLDITAHEVPGSAGACGSRRIRKEMLPRRRPAKCINYHPEEIEIHQCGRSTVVIYNMTIISLLCILTRLCAIIY